MRSALLCVLFALIIHNGSRASDSDFRPIPIPLDAWNYERREARGASVGTLQETVLTDTPPVVAAVPAHYWEDALRHSVYLTLVRDKIDQLIARGVVVSPSNKPEEYVSKEIDDHDLWEKIKKAPFDRLQEDELSSFGDVTVMAKGRLMEDNGGYRFTEDERSKEDCSNDKCMEGVKAFWSVKRVRQRDVETSPGKYHYELTFSVNSQPPIKKRRPHENPVRTFTVRENAPDTVVGIPQEYPVYQPVRHQAPRPQRAVWFHKNIVPKQSTQGRFYQQGLDRIFSSFFSDDDSHPEPPPRYKPNPYGPPVPPMYTPFSKAGHVGMSSDQHHQKRLMPYPYKPHHHMYKYRPPLGPPPVSHMQQHFIDVDVVKHPYVQQAPDHRHISPSNIVKTTRPAVLPTPPNFNATYDSDIELSNNITILEETTKISESTTVYPPTVYKTYKKQRPVKGNYFPEHIRPPVYNAPPGVFVTMEKKPFKPMPPLKHHHHMSKPKRPIDFRPSPQLIDGVYTDIDTDVDSAFKPILQNNKTTEESVDDIEVNGNKLKHTRKQTSKKPPKKHENIKWQPTSSPDDIITVNSDSKEDDSIQWADVLGAFSKTTPMHSNTDRRPESTTQMSPTIKKTTTTTTEAYEEPTTRPTTTTTTTTTPSPKKRTRPPHKFVKPEKVKKHKRITTTTTKAPEQPTLKRPSDLTPQASSAATNAPNSWKPKNKTTTAAPTTPLSTTTVATTTTTTQAPTTKTTPPEETTTKTEPVVTPQPKNKNRFRLTTLMQKGTSVKHDRWSVSNTSVEKKTPDLRTSTKQAPRRKGSNFQGYSSPSTSRYSTRDLVDFQREKHSNERDSVGSSTERIKLIDTNATPMQASFEEIPVHFNVDSTAAYTRHQNEDTEEESEEDDNQDTNAQTTNSEEQDSADQTEFIFDLRSSTPSERTNEININDEDLVVTEQSFEATSFAAPKNKTKCKKKKHNHLVPTTEAQMEEGGTTPQPSPSTTKSSSTGIDFLDDILGSLTYDETTEKATTKGSRQELEEEESENHEKYIKLEEDFEEFLGNLGGGKRGHSDEKDDADVDYEEEEDPEELPEEDEGSPFDNEDVNEHEQHSRESNDTDYDDYRERQYSLLELMAME